jgi:hypothetical protein
MINLKKLYNKYKPVLFRKKRVELGDGHIIAYTLFESKYLFGIIVYNWKTIKQNRFHSHAFSALAFLLSGQYEEEVYKNGLITKRTVNQLFKPRFLPKKYTHRILTAKPKTWTIVFTGPWIKYWYEWFEDTNTWIKYAWGRKVISKSQEAPKEL